MKEDFRPSVSPDISCLFSVCPNIISELGTVTTPKGFVKENKIIQIKLAGMSMIYCTNFYLSK
jgi:hypothetical protein